MHLIALKDLPDGVKAGETFDANDIIAGVLIRIGAAREVDTEIPAVLTRVKRAYRRRDLRVQG